MNLQFSGGQSVGYCCDGGKVKTFSRRFTRIGTDDALAQEIFEGPGFEDAQGQFFQFRSL